MAEKDVVNKERNIFVGYGYDGNDKWIEELIFPLIKSYGFNVTNGKNCYGEESITNAVRERIRNSDGVIVFLTRRDELKEENYYSTHRWCIEELVTAISDKYNVLLNETVNYIVEVRDIRVKIKDGMMFTRQHIPLDPNKKEIAIIELAEALGKWQKKMQQEMQENREKELKARDLILIGTNEPNYDDYIKELANLICEYQFFTKGSCTKIYTTPPYMCTDCSMAAKIEYIPEDNNTMIDITIKHTLKTDFNIKFTRQPIHVHYLKPRTRS